MDGTDEVWVAGKEETAIAFGKFGHGEFLLIPLPYAVLISTKPM
jgi:hypothetical protein